MLTEEEMGQYLRSLVVYFNELKKQDYPFDAMVLGVGYVEVATQQEMAGRIYMLSDLANVPIKMEKINNKFVLKIAMECD